MKHPERCCYWTLCWPSPWMSSLHWPCHLGFFSVFSQFAFFGGISFAVCLFFCPTFPTLGIFRRYDSNETWYTLGGRLGITCWVLQLQTSRRWIPVTEGSASPLCPLFWWAFARFHGGGRRFFFFFLGWGWVDEWINHLQGTINHWFSLIRPYEAVVSASYQGGGFRSFDPYFPKPVEPP